MATSNTPPQPGAPAPTLDAWAPSPRKIGRPRKYTKKLADAVLAELSRGRTLRQICFDPGMPSRTTVYEWVVNDIKNPGETEGFASKYARARELFCDEIFEQTMDIADTPKQGVRRTASQIGEKWECPECERECRWQGVAFFHSEDMSPLCPGVIKPVKKPILRTEAVQADMIDRARLMIDVRKFYIVKVLPRKYGEKVDDGGDRGAERLSEILAGYPKNEVSASDESEGIDLNDPNQNRTDGSPGGAQS